MAEEVKVDTNTNTNENRVYEAGFLVLPNIPEEKIAEVAGNLKDKLASIGATVITDEAPRVLRLAYTMEKVIENKKQKFDTAYFGWVKFLLLPEKLSEVEKYLKSVKELLRFILIKTVRENTVIGRRPAAPTWTKKEEKVEEGAPLTAATAEALDKKIEELAV
jgi:ribosomal protein S6